MAKITKNPLPPPLRPEDISPRQLIAVRVKDVLVDVPTKSTRSGKTTVMLTWEYPGKGIYLNETSKENAVQGFQSDETDNWKDKFCPVIVVRSEFEDRTTHQQSVTPKLWVAPADDWAKLLKQANADAKAAGR
jgi:hypothetical protein